MHHLNVTTHIANWRLDGGREKDEEAAKLLRTSSLPPSVDLEVRYCASVSHVYCPTQNPRHYSTHSFTTVMQHRREKTEGQKEERGKVAGIALIM